MENEEDKFTSDTPEPTSPPPVVAKRPTKGQNIAGLLHNKATRNVIIFIGIVMVIGIALVALSVQTKQPAIPNDFKGASAGHPPADMHKDNLAADSNRFVDAAKNIDIAKSKQAEVTGQSFQPAATSAYTYNPNVPQQPAPGPVEVAVTAAPVAQAAAPQQYHPPGPEAQKRAQAANDAVVSLLTSWNLHGPKIMYAETAVASADPSRNGGNGASAAAAAGNLAKPSVLLIPAGRRIPVGITLPMNSAEPGTPAMATLLAGEFKGSTVLGTFKKNTDDTIRADFTSMSIPAYRITVPIQASTYNLDDIAKQGIASEVDSHYLIKYGLKPLAAAMSAVGTALAQPSVSVASATGLTTTSAPLITAKTAAGIAAGAGANQFNQDASIKNIETTVIEHSGEVVGLAFLKDVVYEGKSEGATGAAQTVATKIP